MSPWIEVCKLGDIPPLGSRVVTSAHGEIAIFRTDDDRVFALRDRCPHKSGPLSQGMVHGDTVTCPLHSWKIELAQGMAVAPDKGCAVSFPTRVENGSVFLSLTPNPRCSNH